MLATMVPLSVLDSLAFLPLDCIRFRCFYHQMQTSDSLWSTWFVQTYFSWQMWRGRGRDQVDWGQGEPPTLYDTGLHHQPILHPFDFSINSKWSSISDDGIFHLQIKNHFDYIFEAWATNLLSQHLPASDLAQTPRCLPRTLWHRYKAKRGSTISSPRKI